MNGSRVRAVGARNLARAQEFAARYRVEKAYGSYEEAVEDLEVDVVYVGTVVSAHFELCLKAIEAGRLFIKRCQFWLCLGIFARFSFSSNSIIDPVRKLNPSGISIYKCFSHVVL